MIDFNLLIDNYIKKEKKIRGIGKYYPSDAGLCMRKVWYNYVYPQDIHPDLSKIFEVGNIIHDFIVNVLKSEKNPDIILLNSELPIKLEVDGIEISGRVDNIIQIKANNKIYLVEVKSAKNLFYINDAQKHNIDQLQLYMHITKIQDGIILYVDKTNLKTKAYEIKYNKEDAERIIERFKKINNFLTERKLPPPEAKENPKNLWMCNYCEYKEKCEKNEC
ncbi:MAG: Dna2/Cas4 domain-containing protein [Candidatus Aenigmatarchaeota archaeon]|nr:PD-(D/E)XK nuclease family protein [Candidatus Aenigmarchaeota archaeon]